MTNFPSSSAPQSKDTCRHRLDRTFSDTTNQVLLADVGITTQLVWYTSQLLGSVDFGSRGPRITRHSRVTASSATQSESFDMVQPDDETRNSKTASFSTANIPASERIDYWEDHNTQALIGYDIRTVEGGPLNAEEHNLFLPTARLAKVHGSSQLVERSEAGIRRHPTGDVAIFFTLSGDAFFYHSTGILTLRAGQAVLCDADQPFVRGFTGGVHELVATIPREEFTRLSNGASLDEPRVFEFFAPGGAPGGDPNANSLARLADATLNAPDHDLESAEERTLELAERMVHRAGGWSQPSAYLQAVQEIQRNYPDSTLTRTRVARAVGVSERQLSRLFTAEGTTFADFLMEQRLQSAERMLLDHQPGTMSRIARRCGFSSPSHFSRVFKAHKGVPPSDLLNAPRLRF